MVAELVLPSESSAQAPLLDYLNSAYYRWTLIVVASAVMALAQLFPNVVVIVNVFQRSGLPAMMGYLVGLPLILLPVAWFRESHWRQEGRPRQPNGGRAHANPARSLENGPPKVRLVNRVGVLAGFRDVA